MQLYAATTAANSNPIITMHNLAAHKKKQQHKSEALHLHNKHIIQSMLAESLGLEITTQFNKWICHSSFVRQTQHNTREDQCKLT